MRVYLHSFDLSGQSGGYARSLNSPGSWDATKWNEQKVDEQTAAWYGAAA